MFFHPDSTLPPKYLFELEMASLVTSKAYLSKIIVLVLTDQVVLELQSIFEENFPIGARIFRCLFSFDASPD